MQQEGRNAENERRFGETPWPFRRAIIASGWSRRLSRLPRTFFSIGSVRVLSRSRSPLLFSVFLAHDPQTSHHCWFLWHSPSLGLFTSFFEQSRRHRATESTRECDIQSSVPRRRRSWRIRECISITYTSSRVLDTRGFVSVKLNLREVSM